MIRHYPAFRIYYIYIHIHKQIYMYTVVFYVINSLMSFFCLLDYCFIFNLFFPPTGDFFI